jgi:crotonobetainyl-CoA:carnitine CoA-transferase CaiB-like acyl-CoA transferase
MRDADAYLTHHASRITYHASGLTMTKLPLEGIRVVDVTVVWAGPHCTQLLAEWGAEVIRVEPLQHIQPSTRGAESGVTQEMVDRNPDTAIPLYAFPRRQAFPRPWNRSPSFNSHARNKRSMTADVTTPEGLDVFRRLIAVADVFVENNVASTIERARITYEDLVPYNPRLIMLRMPAYGLSGPFKNYRSFGTHMEGMTGHHHLRSYPNLDPSMTGDAFTADAAGGVVGALAVLMALRHRRRTGKGQLIELAQAENFMSYLGEIVLDTAMNNRTWPPQGNQHPSHAPHNVYPCCGEERWITIDVGTDAEWEALCAVMGNPPWTRDRRFRDQLARWHHRDELDRHIAAWTADQDAFDLFHRLVAAGVCAGPVQNERDALACPHLNERGFFEELDHPEFGAYRYPGLNLRMSHIPNHLRRHPVRLGEDNEYVYRDLLGIADDEYAGLERLGHIGMDYPSPAPASRA